MNDLDWSMIKYFKSKEFNFPDKMKLAFVGLLDDLRAKSKQAIVIHSDYRENSIRHKSGMCVDLHIKNTSLIDQFLIAERIGFLGIGLYPDWNNAGLHLDMHKKGRWIRIGETKYIELNKENLIKYCLEE